MHIRDEYCSWQEPHFRSFSRLLHGQRLYDDPRKNAQGQQLQKRRLRAHRPSSSIISLRCCQGRQLVKVSKQIDSIDFVFWFCIIKAEKEIQEFRCMDDYWASIAVRRRISADSAADAQMMITAEAVSSSDMIGLRGEEFRDMPVASHRGDMHNEASFIGHIATGVDEVNSKLSANNLGDHQIWRRAGTCIYFWKIEAAHTHFLSCSVRFNARHIFLHVVSAQPLMLLISKNCVSFV